MTSQYRNNNDKVQRLHMASVDHRRDEIGTEKNIIMTSQWTSWRPKAPATALFVKPSVQAGIKENIKFSHYWSSVRRVHRGLVDPLAKAEKFPCHHDVIMSKPCACVDHLSWNHSRLYWSIFLVNVLLQHNLSSLARPRNSILLCGVFAKHVHAPCLYITPALISN